MLKHLLFLAVSAFATQAMAQSTYGPQPLPGVSLPIGVANGGTGVTTSTGSGAVVLATNPTIIGASTGQVFNILTYGASPAASAATNTTAIQAAITAAQTANGVVYIPSAGGSGGCYNTTAGGLTISNNLTIIGDHEIDSWSAGADVPLGTPPLLGSVLCPTSNGSAGLLISGTSLTVNIKDIGISFGSGLSGTGDGINYIPSGTNQGLSGSTWSHVRVYGVDGNHYAYNLQNFLFDDFDQLYAYGGGCLNLYGNSTTTNYGNSHFKHFYGKTFTGGSAHCVNIAASAAQRLNGLYFTEGTAVTANLCGVGLSCGNLPTSAQYIWKEDSNVRYISGAGMDLETNVASKVAQGSSAQSNDLDWKSMLTDAAAIEAPAWTTNGIMYGPTTQTLTDTSSSGTVAVQATNAMPSVTLKASSATTYTKAPTLYLGAPVASTNVTITSPQSLYATGEVYTTADFSSAGGLFANGTTQLNKNNGSSTTEIGNGTTSGTVTIGGASNATNISSATMTVSGTATKSGASAASTPAEIFTGAIYTGGTGTTDFPHLLVQPSTATASTTWSTTGTAIGANAHTGVGNLIDLQVDGTSEFRVSAGGSIANLGALTIGSTGNFQFGSRGILTSPTGGKIQLGAADAASPVAQTVTTQNVVAGTSNTAGVSTTIAGSQGTGTGVGGSLIIQTAPAGTTGTAQNALATAVTIDSTGLVTLTPQAGAYSLSLTPPSVTSGTTGTGINVISTVNDASSIDGVTWFSNTTCTSCTNGSQIFDWQVGGSSIFKSDKFGDITAAGGITQGSANQFLWTGRGILTSPGSADIQMGGTNAASAVAQTLSTQGSRGGTDTNVAGGNLTIQSGLGTGNATGSLLILQTPHAGSTGAAAETATTQISLGDNTVGMPNLASSSAATTGTVCWTTSTGNLTVDTTVACLASDLRTKMNIKPLDAGLAEVMALKPISYDNKPEFNGKHLGRQVGLGAQDVQKVDPRLVSLYAAGPDEGTPQGVRYMQLTAVLIKAIQQQEAEIAALKTELHHLEHH